jgi:hypothetical protein
MTRDTDDTHNDLSTWLTLSAATERVLEFDEQKKKQTGGKPNSGDGDEKKTEKDCADIEKRLRELRAMQKALKRN